MALRIRTVRDLDEQAAAFSAIGHYFGWVPTREDAERFRPLLPLDRMHAVFDDGLADGVGSRGVRKTSEFRLEYQRKAFETKWVRGWWSAGYRELSHERILDASYFAIVPNLPPVIPPIVDQAFDPATLVPAHRRRETGRGRRSSGP